MKILRACLLLLLMVSSCLVKPGGFACNDARETLLVATSYAPDTELGYTPFEQQDGARNFVKGFDVEVAKELRIRLGYKDLKFAQVSFGDLINQSVNGTTIVGDKVIIGMAAVSITNARKNDPNLDLDGNQAFIKYNDDTMGIILSEDLIATNPEILGNPNLVLGGLNAFAKNRSGPLGLGTTTAARQEDIIDTKPIYSDLFPDDGDTLQGAIDQLTNVVPFTEGIFTDEPSAEAILPAVNDAAQANNFGDFAVVAPVPVDVKNEVNLIVQESDGLGIVINRNCCQLYVDIAQAIKDMEADGTLPRLRKEFNVGSFTPVDLTPEECRGFRPKVNNNQSGLFLNRKFCDEGPVPVVNVTGG